MRTITGIVSSIAASISLGAAACNAGSTGDSDRLSFTPAACGNALLGCDFSDGVALWADLSVKLAGLDGTSVDGLNLRSGDPAVLAVTDIADDGAPTWELHGASAGVATLEAVDGAGVVIDSIDITVKAPQRLGLVELAGDAVGPTAETGVDEAWTAPAGQLVSFQAVPLYDDDRLIGRLTYMFVIPGSSTLLDTEQSSSDRPAGYLYVQPPAGDYPFTIELAADAGTVRSVMLHAR